MLVISLLIGLWFYDKLDMVSIHIPFGGDIYLGILIIPFFALVTLATFSGVIDGLDGLSGGVLSAIFGAYAIIAFANNQIKAPSSRFLWGCHWSDFGFCGLIFHQPDFIWERRGSWDSAITLATIAH